jgi:MHS family proline/betaine transporter-like MFS transporter
MGSAASPPATTSDGPSKSVLRKAIAGSAIGNATEWFDYGVYAYVATEIGDNFFPGDYSTLGALLVFAVSFVLRPLGGIVWGPLGDRIGRQRVLATTILLMAASTFLVGVLPTYDSVGLLAPVLLVLLRVIQGFSTGGEYGGAATFMAEYAPDRKRGFYGSFLEFGTISGFTAAVGLVFLLQSTLGDAAMTEWGWRIPFLVAGPLGVIGMYLRTRLEDTPVFQELSDTGHVERSAKTALTDLMSMFWRPVLTLIGLVLALNVANYTLLAYMPTYLESTTDLSASQGDLLVIIGQLAMMALMPIAGATSDRIGRKPMWWASLVGLFVLAIPMFMLMSQGFAPAVVGFAVLGLVYVLQLSTISATFPAMFPSHVRYGGMAIAYNISTAVFGGTAPAANDALINATGSDLVPAFYMMGACLIGMVAMLFVVETAGCSLRGTEIPGTEESERELATMEQ